MLNPSTCPACGADNACAVAAGASASCWCFEVTVPAEALQALPEPARATVCLCPRCATDGAQPCPLPSEPRNAD